VKCTVFLVLGWVPAFVGAQQDSTRTQALDPVVVTAERSARPLSKTASSVTRLSGEELRRTPGVTLVDVLRLLPGFTAVDFDGSDGDPQLMARGFYGGGEADYVIVLVDGIPVNQLHNGRVAWTALPSPASIAGIEVVRGSASPVWGDAAIGGVVNILTARAGTAPSSRWMLGGGTHRALQSSVDGAASLLGRRVWGSAQFDRASGFRDHSARRASGARAGIVLADTPQATVSLGAQLHHRWFEEPGALLESLAATDRSSSDPLFRFDETNEWSSTFTVDLRRRLTPSVTLRGALTRQWRDLDAVRTLALAPGFGDTRARDAVMGGRRVTSQLEIDDARRKGTLVIGAELNRGTLDSRYHEVMTGTRDDYATASGARGALSSTGYAVRGAIALFAHYALEILPPVRVSLGARTDWLDDEFAPTIPSGGNFAASHAASSPKLGLNVRYLESPGSSGHVFVAASRSFKAPTLDQLYDQRPIPVPDPPFTITTSNPALSPQRGTNYEAGVQHALAITGRSRFSGTLGVYQMDMRDELDFDVATLRYRNIGRSRHRGLEAGAEWSTSGRWSAFTNYTLQDVTSQAGPSKGNRLKAIPRQALAGGVMLSPGPLPELRLTATHQRDIFLDDANTRELPPWTRLDAQLTQRLGSLFAVVQVRNVLGARHNTTGFPDPSGSGLMYVHPAAARTVHLAIRSGG
jgi:outer membrane receptor protein involved in Fe transport